MEYEYGFIADDGPVISRAFGVVPFDSVAMAKHTGVKWFYDTLVIVRRIKGSEDEWETVPD